MSIRCPHDGCDCMSFARLEGLNPRAVRHVTDGFENDTEGDHGKLDDLWEAVLEDIAKDHPDDETRPAEERLRRAKYVARAALDALKLVPTRWYA